MTQSPSKSPPLNMYNRTGGEDSTYEFDGRRRRNGKHKHSVQEKINGYTRPFMLWPLPFFSTSSLAPFPSKTPLCTAAWQWHPCSVWNIPCTPPPALCSLCPGCFFSLIFCYFPISPSKFNPNTTPSLKILFLLGKVSHLFLMQYLLVLKTVDLRAKLPTFKFKFHQLLTGRSCWKLYVIWDFILLTC